MELDKTKLPRHVAIIMDGNRRWAKKRGLSVVAGHTYAADEVLENLIEWAGERGIKYLTLWAFSTENWHRDQREVEGIMRLFKKTLASKVEKFVAKGAKLRVIGDMSKFDEKIRKGMKKAVEASRNNTKITVTFALNYGGRDEILRAAGKMVKKLQSLKKGLELRKEEFGKFLDTGGMPDPDLIIRTGGEQRLSGFLPWQSVYSELYFTEVLFPDFSAREFDKALVEYARRQRRFGR